MTHYTNTQFLARAQEAYQVDGEVEFDDDAQVSRTHRGDAGYTPTGAYVQAWVWVELPEGHEGGQR